MCKYDPSRVGPHTVGDMHAVDLGDQGGLLPIVDGGDWPRVVLSGELTCGRHHCNKSAVDHNAGRRRRSRHS